MRVVKLLYDRIYPDFGKIEEINGSEAGQMYTKYPTGQNIFHFNLKNTFKHNGFSTFAN